MEEKYCLGNELLRAGKCEDALAAYEASLMLCVFPQDVDHMLRLLSNIGFAHIKLRNPSLAIKTFTEVLDKIDIFRSLTECGTLTKSNCSECPGDAHKTWTTLLEKSLLRRADCYKVVGEYQKALDDVDRVAQMKGENDLPLTLLQERHKLRELLRQDISSAKQGGTARWMAHGNHALRVSLLSGPPNHTAIGVPFTCRIGLGNELGLYNRQMYAAGAFASSEPLGWVQCAAHVTGRNGEDMSASVTLKQICGTSPIVESPLKEDGKAVIHLLMTCESEVWPDIDDEDLLISLEFSMTRFPFNQSPSLSVLPLITLPFRLTRSQFPKPSERVSHSTSTEKLLESMSAVQVNCLRPVSLPHSEERVLCGESVGLLGIGGKVWDSSFVLLQYLHKHAEHWIVGRRVLELGAGTGVTGLSLAGSGAISVTMTDLPEVVPLLQVNIDINRVLNPSLRERIGDRYRAVAYLWGTPREVTPEEVLSCDVVIASDVVYDPSGYEPLLTSLEILLAGEKRCLLAHRHRHPEDKLFFDALQASSLLTVQDVDWQSDLCSEQSQQLKDVRLLIIQGK